VPFRPGECALPVAKRSLTIPKTRVRGVLVGSIEAI
jgi:hypothetical protein